MGLDQYAYVAAKARQRDEFYEGSEFNKETGNFENPNVTEPREIAYWRKHPNLQGWMEKLAESKGLEYDTFNGVELELTLEDLNKLEDDIKYGEMAKLGTTGFFFGNPSDDYYKQDDLAFIRNAKAELFCGLKVFYNSSW